VTLTFFLFLAPFSSGKSFCAGQCFWMSVVPRESATWKRPQHYSCIWVAKFYQASGLCCAEECDKGGQQ
jgi:hypothetical protein